MATHKIKTNMRGFQKWMNTNKNGTYIGNYTKKERGYQAPFGTTLFFL